MRATERPVPINRRYRRAELDREGARRLIGHCLDAEDARSALGVGLVLVGDRTMRRLNRDFRGRDRTTDVLSFAFEVGDGLEGIEDDPDARTLGEVVISVPRCFAQAQEQRVDAGVELVRLIVHGVLHVLGYDHERTEDRARMEPRERHHRSWARRAGIGSGLLRASGADR